MLTHIHYLIGLTKHTPRWQIITIIIIIIIIIVIIIIIIIIIIARKSQIL